MIASGEYLRRRGFLSTRAALALITSRQGD